MQITRTVQRVFRESWTCPQPNCGGEMVFDMWQDNFHKSANLHAHVCNKCRFTGHAPLKYPGLAYGAEIEQPAEKQPDRSVLRSVAVFYEDQLLVVIEDVPPGLCIMGDMAVLDWYAKEYGFDRSKLRGVGIVPIKYEEAKD